MSPSKRKLQHTALAIDSAKWVLPGGNNKFKTLIINIRETTNTVCDIKNHHVLEESMSAVVFHKARSFHRRTQQYEKQQMKSGGSFVSFMPHLLDLFLANAYRRANMEIDHA